MAQLEEVRVGVRPLEQFSPLVPKKHMREAMKIALKSRNALAKRVFWNVNSTAVGGGVAEMLPSLCAYARSIGIDTTALPSTKRRERSTRRPFAAIPPTSWHWSDRGTSCCCTIRRRSVSPDPC
jgi:hypothetical protein